MTIEQVQESIQQLTDSEVEQLGVWIYGEEMNRRAAQPAIEQAQADIVTELQDAGKLEKPEVATEEQAKKDAARVPEWRNPGTDHELMYREGDIVRYKGRIVRSTHKGLNHWEPGTLAFDGRIWEDITPKTLDEEPEAEPKPEEETEAPEPEAPTTKQWEPNIAVKAGDQYTYNGATYEVIQPHNTQAGWEPSGVPALWKKL